MSGSEETALGFGSDGCAQFIKKLGWGAVVGCMGGQRLVWGGGKRCVGKEKGSGSGGLSGTKEAESGLGLRLGS